MPGVERLKGQYSTFQAWMIEKKISEGHSEKEAFNVPTLEIVDELIFWLDNGKPNAFA